MTAALRSVTHPHIRVAWLALLALALLAPVAATALVGAGEPATVWTELGVITGTQAAGAMVAALLFAARHRSITSAFGIDGALGLHRGLGTVGLLLVLAHLLLVLVDDPANIALLHPTDAPPRAAAGVGSGLSLILLAGLSVARRRTGMRYEVWRWGHLVLAVVASTLAVLHITWVDRLINDPLWLAWFGVLLVTAIGVLVTRWAWRPARAARWMVDAVESLGGGMSRISMTPLDGDGMTYRAGQFAWMRLSRWRTDHDHPFTMASSPLDNYVEFVVAHRGDWTEGPLRDVRPGQLLWLDGPHGDMTLDRAVGGGIVMAAAGAGMAPMLSMLRTLAHQRDRRPLWLFLPPSHPFDPDLAAVEHLLDLRVCPVLSRPITAATLAPHLSHPAVVSRATHFLCGPPQMVADVEAALLPLGARPRAIHTERFDH